MKSEGGMRRMIEVLWHGRGGQGAFTAARLLGAAASLAEGRHALAFPSFGPERRGAPIKAFTKIDDAPIGDRSAIAHADFVLYLDDTLLGEGYADELKPGGRLIVNSTESFNDERIVAIDADGISANIPGRPIPNTVLLGALSALCDRVAIEDVKEAIREYMPERLHAKNLAIVDAARVAVLECGKADGAQTGEAGGPIGENLAGATSDGFQGEVPGGSPSAEAVLAPPRAAAPARPEARIPSLKNTALDPHEFAHATCFEAGHLVSTNAGWRSVRPVLDPVACTGCLQCYLHCPDGAVFKVGTSTAASELAFAPVAIDYDFCKGCGICSAVCRFGALAMVPEKEALAAETVIAPVDESEAHVR